MFSIPKPPLSVSIPFARPDARKQLEIRRLLSTRAAGQPAQFQELLDTLESARFLIAVYE